MSGSWVGGFKIGKSPAISLVDGIRLDKTVGDLRNRSRLYIEFGCKELKLSNKVRKNALKMLYATNGPYGTRTGAAAVVYIVAYLNREYRNQRDVCKVFNIRYYGFNALSENYRKIAKKLKLPTVVPERRGIRTGKKLHTKHILTVMVTERVYFPNDVLDALDLKSGDRVSFSISGEDVLVKKSNSTTRREPYQARTGYKIGSSQRVYIPYVVMQKLKLEIGSKVMFQLRGRKVYLRNASTSFS